MSPLTYTDAVGGALERLRGVGFEHGPRFVNHAPMAAEALAYMGYADDVPRWVDRNLRTHTYHEVPDARWAIDPADPDDWRSALGDFSRVADWTALFERELALTPWPEVLARWWPRLLPGMSGVLTHGVIRTAHAVRAISRAGEENLAYRRELAQGLGYWAARYASHTHGIRPGDEYPGTGEGEEYPRMGDGGGDTRTGSGEQGPRTGSGEQDPRKGDGEQDPRTADADSAAAALDGLVAEYAGIYASAPQRHPVPLIHSITGPAAVRLVVEHLPAAQRRPSYLVARDVSASMLDWFSTTPVTTPPVGTSSVPDLGEVFATAVAIGDEHAIKLAEVAVRHQALAPDPRLAAAAHAANQGLARFRR
ncbi:Pd2U [Streptomyces microflavus DSM 40593]|uniref:Pd2U n=1 Tax=Streptomyces microflavus DSM 40593 TaxID=1303692 RepID=N0CRW2_STRMI|nr:questin oxidase family protein [Streptomyces microflavus]AGK78901.1 Pd2U [Streptomyces microflavus DSM 40593]